MDGWIRLLVICFVLNYYSYFQIVRIYNVSMMIRLQKIQMLYSSIVCSLLFFSIYVSARQKQLKVEGWKKRRWQRSKGARDRTGGCQLGLKRVKGGGGD